MNGDVFVLVCRVVLMLFFRWLLSVVSLFLMIMVLMLVDSMSICIVVVVLWNRLLWSLVVCGFFVLVVLKMFLIGRVFGCFQVFVRVLLLQNVLMYLCCLQLQSCLCGLMERCLILFVVFCVLCQMCLLIMMFVVIFVLRFRQVIELVILFSVVVLRVVVFMLFFIWNGMLSVCFVCVVRLRDWMLRLMV